MQKRVLTAIILSYLVIQPATAVQVDLAGSERGYYAPSVYSPSSSYAAPERLTLSGEVWQPGGGYQAVPVAPAPMRYQAPTAVNATYSPQPTPVRQEAVAVVQQEPVEIIELNRERSPNYLGVTLGSSSYDLQLNAVVDPNVARADEEDWVLRFLFGKNLNDWVDIEGQIVDFGVFEVRGYGGDQYQFAGETITMGYSTDALKGTFINVAETDLLSYGLAVKVKAPIISRFFIQPFFKLGFHYWDAEINQKTPGREGTSVPSSVNYSFDGTDFFYGLGVKVRLLNQENPWFGRIEYERYVINGDDLDTLSMGFVYQF
jgi:hypothetical protein